MVSSSSRRRRSGDCTCSAKSRIVLKSERSRLNAVADISRWCRTSQATISGLAGGEPEARTQLHRDLGAEFRMVAAAPLGDVVEQHRDIEHAARDELVDHDMRQRMIGGELTALDPAEQVDRVDGMLVDGGSGGTCRTASAPRRGRNRGRSARTLPPRSSSAARGPACAARSAARGTARWRADRTAPRRPAWRRARPAASSADGPRARGDRRA